jgi:DNA-binding beta-propeller fold protein YncE
LPGDHQGFPGNPYGMAADGQSRLFVATANAKTIYVANYKEEWHREPFTDKRFEDAYGVAVTWDGKDVYVADAGAKKVWQYAANSGWSEIGTFSDPYAVTVDGAGTVYVADAGGKLVWKMTPPH